MNWEFLRSDELADAIEKSGGLAHIVKVLKEDEKCVNIATGQ